MVLILAGMTMHAWAQKSNAEEFYLWDARFKPVTNNDSAKFFTSVIKISDTCWQWDTYQMFGPLVTSEQFKDHDGTIMHGRFIQYHSDGYIDSTGTLVNGLANGDWFFFNDTGKFVLQKQYVRGELVLTRDILKEEKQNKDDKPAKIYDDEKESEFKGGIAKWQRYLLKNMKYPERAYNMKKDGMVVVQFVVNKDGDTEEIDIFHSVEYSLDKEAMRIIRKSPKWIPAYQNGRIVNSYKRQPVIFGL